MSGLRSVSLVAVGDELLAGAHPDLNSPELAKRLGALGLEVRDVCVVPDDESAIEEAVRRGAEGSALVLVTGGLGPTLDDVTRHGIARALGRELEQNADAAAALEAWSAQRGLPLAQANLRQALFPSGAELIPNRAGTAPGFWAEGEAVVVALPGPPVEMRIVFEDEVQPRLVSRGLGKAPLEERRFFLFGLSESVFADRVAHWMERDASPRMGCSVKKGVLSVVMRAAGSDPARALADLERRAEAFQAGFGEHMFSRDDFRLEHVLGRRLIEGGIGVSLAESCTAGLACSLLARVPGISAVLQRSFITYDNRAKEELLGVDPALLERHGAVSPEVAEAMARGAAQAAGARLGLSITGVAGPDGGSAEKPVGLVWLGTSLDGEARSKELRLPPLNRDWIRGLSARHALFAGFKRLPGPFGGE